MASLGDMYLMYEARKYLNQPTQAEREMGRLDREHAQMIKSQGMALEHQKLEEQKRQNAHERQRDLIAVQAEYAAAMGQEMKAPTDPRLTQTHKAATTKGQYTHGKAQAKAAGEQRDMLWKMMEAQSKADQWRDEQDVREGRLDETKRHNLRSEEAAMLRAGGLSGLASGMKAKEMLSATRSLINMYDKKIQEASDINKIQAGIFSQEAAQRLKAERDELVLGYRRQLQALGVETVPGLSEVLGGTGVGESAKDANITSLIGEYLK